MRRSDGFTLMEVMATAAVIAIICAVLVGTGLSWLKSYSFNAMARSFSHAVLAARMQSLENKSVLRVYSVTYPGDFLTDPATLKTYARIRFSTKKPAVTDQIQLDAMKHRFLARVPVYPSANRITQRGDFVMFAGLDMNCNMNGAEKEVMTVVDPWTFEIMGPPPPFPTATNPLPDLTLSVTTPTVRNLTSSGKLRVVPAVYKTNINPSTTTENEATFDSKGYTLSQVGYAATFTYDAARFQVFFDDPGLANPLSPTGSAYGSNPANAPPFSFVELRFDSRGLPNDFTRHTFVIQEVVPTGSAKKPQQVQYTVTSAGRVTGGFDSSQ